MKIGLIVAGVASALAAAIVAYDGIWTLSVAVGLPAAVLLVAEWLLRKGWRERIDDANARRRDIADVAGHQR